MSSLKYWDGTQWVSVSVDASNYTTTVQSNLNAHTSLTNAVHGSTSSSTPNSLVQRDGSAGTTFGGTLTASTLLVNSSATITGALTLSFGGITISTGGITSASSITSSTGSLISGTTTGTQGTLQLYSGNTGAYSQLRSQNTTSQTSINYLPTNLGGELMLASGANATSSPNYLNSYYYILTSDKVFYGPGSPTGSSTGNIFTSGLLPSGTYIVDGTLYWQASCTSATSFYVNTSAWLYHSAGITGAINYTTTYTNNGSSGPPASGNGGTITGLITSASSSQVFNSTGLSASFNGANSITATSSNTAFVSTQFSGVITISNSNATLSITATAASSNATVLTYFKATLGSYLRLTPVPTLPSKGTWS
jgi:hypothetical protein